jgi:nucleoid DNA-binding protein
MVEKKEKIKMTKNEVLKAVSNKVEGASQKDIAVILDAFADVITETLTTQNQLQLENLESLRLRQFQSVEEKL